MVLKLSKQQKEKILRLVEKKEDLPDGYKDLLFPNQKKEYELVYAGKERKEDIIAETMAVPFQKIKTFGKNDNGWTNKLIFGDNLQVLKEIYNDQRDKNLLDTKDKIKLIYIDPPFSTRQDFMKDGEKVYQDKVIGAEFLEFLRERLILAKEILADDGSIFVHLDHKKGHYVKILLDEIFGENNLVNEIIWCRSSSSAIKAGSKDDENSKTFIKAHDTIYIYANNIRLFKGIKKTQLTSIPYSDRVLASIEEDDEGNVVYNRGGGSIGGKKISEKVNVDIDAGMLARSFWVDIPILRHNSSDNVNYPTQKPEKLLGRIIDGVTMDNDIVLDFFAGSGTTLAAAEKLGRKWIGCDCGKLSIYTIQKRILNIASSKDLLDKEKKYAKDYKPFTLYNAGLYDYNKIKELPWNEYRTFALNLFEVRDEPHKLSGIELDGFRGNDNAIVFNHEKYKKAVLDYGFIDDLHKNLGAKITNKFFIIVPAGNVDFLEDYVERGNVRYYILRIPYSIINELHNRDFENIKQPVDEKDVNNTVEAVGFDFIQTPEVDCEYKKSKTELTIKILKFKSRVRSKKPIRYKGKETLSMVMIDFNFNSEVFDLDKTYFAENLKKDVYQVKFDKNQLDQKMMIIYMDIFGNEKKEIKELKDFK